MDPAFGPYPLGRQESIHTCATAEVQHDLTDLKFGHGRGISAGQAKVRPFGEGRQFSDRVADTLCYFSDTTTATAGGLGATASTAYFGDGPIGFPYEEMGGMGLSFHGMPFQMQ
jgi:hypothetical protein